jgi:hypothetical protein
VDVVADVGVGEGMLLSEVGYDVGVEIGTLSVVVPASEGADVVGINVGGPHGSV